MHREDGRPEHLAWIEIALRAANPDLPDLAFSGQSHYGPSDRLAFIDVHGVGADRARRRKIRAEASALLRRLGYAVELEPGRDVFNILPERPGSAHEEVEMLQRLRIALAPSRDG